MADDPAAAHRPAGAACFDDYARYVSPLQTVEPIDSDLAAFSWKSRLVAMAPASFSRVRIASHRSQRSPAWCSRNGLDHVIVYHRLSGAAEMRIGATARQMHAGDITFMDLSRPMEARGPIDAICVAFPRTLIAPLVDSIDGLHGRSMTPSTALGRLAASHLKALAAEIASLGPAEAHAVANATASLLAACANASPALEDETRARARPALLLTVRRHIEQHLHDPHLSAAVVAHHFGLSRSTIFRLFHSFGGVEIYIRRRRLAHAYKRLSSAGDRSSDYCYQVAEACGYSSATAFSRAFRAEFGVTARDVAAGMTEPPPISATDLSRCLHDMVFQPA